MHVCTGMCTPHQSGATTVGLLVDTHEERVESICEIVEVWRIEMPDFIYMAR